MESDCTKTPVIVCAVKLLSSCFCASGNAYLVETIFILAVVPPDSGYLHVH